MSAQVRPRVVRLLKLGALAVAIASFVSCGLLVVSDYAARAQATTDPGAMVGAGCGGDCAEQPGSCAAEAQERADKVSGCPMTKAADDPAACEGQDCTDCDVDCPHHQPTAANEPAKV